MKIEFTPQAAFSICGISNKRKGSIIMKKALIAMSGGVDSSVAALLMQQKGYACTGVTMKLFENEQAGIKREKTCCSLDDVEDARSVAYRLHMPYYVFNFTANFEEEVMDRFVDAYAHGCTPNPCIDCNRYLKFQRLYQRMQELQMDTIVTGHYARVAYDADQKRWLLKKGLDVSKDQSYVLFNLTQEQLAHTCFPVGELTKDQVRHLAEENDFLNADKPDSQDICFAPDGDYAGFIERHTGDSAKPGDFLDLQGNVIGKHRGIIHYTIGQRRGLGIAAAHPLYVCRIDPVRNTVTLGESSALFARELIAEDVNLITCDAIPEPIQVQAKIRYRQPAQPAMAWQTPDGKLHIRFDVPQRAITCGQAAVLYDGENVVGGGTISWVSEPESV